MPNKFAKEYHMGVVKRIYKMLEGPVGFGASIVTLVLVINTENVYFKIGLAIVAVVYIISIVTYIVKCLFDVNKARYELEQSNFNSNGRIAETMHNYYHNLRDYTSSVYSTEELTIKDVRESCKNICGYIAEIYKSIFSSCLGDNNISVCIKLIKTESMFDEDYMNWEMETIARNTATVQERLNDDNKIVKIADNTDFQIIISDKYNDDLFSFADMRNIKEDFLQTYKIEYKNSRGNDFIKYYRSTIVIPVKIDCTHISKRFAAQLQKKDEKSLVLGFLCIDSMKVFETLYEKDLFTLGVSYSKSIADSLYLFFEKVLLCHIEHDRMVSNRKAGGRNNKRKSYPKGRK